MAGTNPAEVLRKWGEALNRHDLDAATATIDPNFVMNESSSNEPVKGREGYRKLWEPLLKAFPDLQVRIPNIVAEGNKLAAEIMATGTFKNPLEYPQSVIPPTGQRAELRWAAFATVNPNGLLMEGRTYAPSFLQQLGVKA